MSPDTNYEQILGVRFYVGDSQHAVDMVSEQGGLVVVPAAPALKNLPIDHGYREALLGADFAITDSVMMVLLWNMIHTRRIPKFSGLKYLTMLLKRPEMQEAGKSFWVMPTPKAARQNLAWLRSEGIAVSEQDTYLAPLYGPVIHDEDLLRQLEERKPKHIVLGIGGGTQERLGLYLKKNLSYRPAIHCIGAAIAFLSGDQVHIPMWVDALGMGWLLRTWSDPKRFLPRYWDARHLVPILLKDRDQLPVAT
jgi:N-acetylglucosaminyldiphosphoundecaprenol N-acetyl-beta-D-mannosaminyltransferase